jgi:taurine dioxygenase
MAVTVTPSGAALGAAVSGFDIADMSDADFAAVHQAFLDHQVILVRGQRFDDAAHRAFTQRFGELEYSPTTKFSGKPWLADFPEMSQITNKMVDGKPIGTLGDREAFWHTDMSYIEEPPLGSLLHAFEVPPSGGDTEFLDMVAALDEMPADLRREIEDREIKHESIHSSDGSLRNGKTEPESGDPRDMEGTNHPIIRTHPETGRNALFLGRRNNAYVVGLPLDDSEALLDALWSYVVGCSHLTWRHIWKVDDLIMWDNRCTMHRRDAFDGDKYIRMMHRTVVKGDKPFYDRAA